MPPTAIPAIAGPDKPGTGGGPVREAVPSGPVHFCWLELVTFPRRMMYAAGEIALVLGSMDPVASTVLLTNRSRPAPTSSTATLVV